MDEKLLLSKIDAAEQQLELAERELAEAIGALRSVPRAEKTVTNRLIEDALGNVKASRSRLVELKSIGVPGDDPR